MNKTEILALKDAIVLMRDLAEYQNKTSELLEIIRDAKKEPSARFYFEFRGVKKRVDTHIENIDMVTADITNILSSLNYESIPAHYKEIIDAFTAMQFALKAKDKDNFCTFRQKWNELIKGCLPS